MGGRPIVILGLCKRTGTNFLAQLLIRHPDAAQAPPVWEHFLLNEADHLERYAARTRRHWSPAWGDLDGLEADLLDHVGAGALRFLDERCGAERTVAKCPSVRNLHLVPAIFGGCDVVFLARDGRSTAASLVNGFGWPMERAVRTWSRGAAEVRTYLTGLGVSRSTEGALAAGVDRNGVRVTLVRYEDFVDPDSSAIDELLTFLELEPARYDRGAAATMPIYGSSFESGDVNWKGAARTDDFDPSRRFADWTREDHDRFDHVGGDHNAWFGYDRSGEGGAPAHRVADVVWPVRKQWLRVSAKLESLRR